MNRNIKYKQVTRLSLFGDDDVNTTTNSQYIVYPSTINSVTVNSGGTNYNTSATQVTISGGGGSGAVLTPTISGGVITALTVSNAGIGYTGPPTISITSGLINTTSLVGGTGYVDVNTQFVITGGGGTGTVIIPTVTSGVITALTITSFGSGYVTTPTITITSGITGTSNIVAGSGYTNGIYPLVVTGGGGSGCSGSFTISGGVLSSIVIGNAGTGYTSAPTLSFPGAGAGTGASAIATLGTGASVTAVIGSGATASIGGVVTNAKRLRFTLNNVLNDLNLSQNARCVVESCNIQTIPNMAGRWR